MTLKKTPSRRKKTREEKKLKWIPLKMKKGFYPVAKYSEFTCVFFYGFQVVFYGQMFIYKHEIINEIQTKTTKTLVCRKLKANLMRC